MDSNVDSRAESPSRLFISGSGTGVGKTVVARALVRALVNQGQRVAGLKPIETGCTPYPLDAMALAAAAREPTLADHPAWYRAELPASPYAVQLATGLVVDARAIVAAIRELEPAYASVVVEGAGGLLVPLDRTQSMADLALALGYPVLLVADNRLGVLSHVLAAYEAARSRELPVAAVVLTEPQVVEPSDPSVLTNHRILAERLGCPIFDFPNMPAVDDDDMLAKSALASGVLEALTRAR